MQNYSDRLRDLQSRAQQLKGAYKVVHDTYSTLQMKFAQKKTVLNTVEESRVVFQTVAQQTMARLEMQISSLVTMGLRAVFPDPPEFVARMVSRRNKTECDLLYLQDGEEVVPVESSGGGLLDVTSFALRAAYWSLKRTAPIFILDEPFKFVSPDLQPKVEAMLRLFCERLHVQIIMVSHAEHLSSNNDTDQIITVRKVDGESVIS